MKKPSEKKRKRRGDVAAAGEASPSPAADGASFDRHVLPILLAAAARTTIHPNQHDRISSSTAAAAAAARLLRRVLSRSPPPLSPLPASFVALLPLLLSSSSFSVAALSCELLGEAALQSMEASEMLASDGGIADGLARALGNGSRRLAEAACNCIMDLSSSSVGREHLAGSPVLPRLLWNLFLGLSIAGRLSAQKEF